MHAYFEPPMKHPSIWSKQEDQKDHYPFAIVFVFSPMSLLGIKTSIVLIQCPCSHLHTHAHRLTQTQTEGHR